MITRNTAPAVNNPNMQECKIAEIKKSSPERNDSLIATKKDVPGAATNHQSSHLSSDVIDGEKIQKTLENPSNNNIVNRKEIVRGY